MYLTFGVSRKKNMCIMCKTVHAKLTRKYNFFHAELLRQWNIDILVVPRDILTNKYTYRYHIFIHKTQKLMSCQMCVGFFTSAKQSLYTFYAAKFFINKHNLTKCCLKQRPKRKILHATKRNCYFSSSFLQIILVK